MIIFVYVSPLPNLTSSQLLLSKVLYFTDCPYDRNSYYSFILSFMMQSSNVCGCHYINSVAKTILSLSWSLKKLSSIRPQIKNIFRVLIKTTWFTIRDTVHTIHSSRTLQIDADTKHATGQRTMPASSLCNDYIEGVRQGGRGRWQGKLFMCRAEGVNGGTIIR